MNVEEKLSRGTKKANGVKGRSIGGNTLNANYTLVWRYPYGTQHHVQ